MSKKPYRATKVGRPVRSLEDIERARVQQAEWEASRAAKPPVPQPQRTERRRNGSPGADPNSPQRLEQRQILYAQLDREEAARAAKRQPATTAPPPKPKSVARPKPPRKDQASQPKRVAEFEDGVWRSSGTNAARKGRKQPMVKPVVADKRQRKRDALRSDVIPGTVHATTMSAPFGASVRRINGLGTKAVARPKVKRRKPNRRNATPTESTREPISDELRWAVLNRDRHVCRYCGSKHGPFHMDHVIPVALGGPTTFANLVTACAPCNLRKGAQVWTPNPISA